MVKAGQEQEENQKGGESWEPIEYNTSRRRMGGCQSRVRIV